MSVRVLVGDCRDILKTLPDESVQCVVTSPPYYGLRDYGVDGIGLEPTMDEYIAEMVAVFREVRRVLRSDGTCWLNLGDSYAGSGAVGGGNRKGNENGQHDAMAVIGRPPIPNKLKPKDLMGIPWRVALALQADGWWLRQDIIWHKPNPMPESVTDRCTKAHEYVFLLTKSARYFYDAEAIKKPMADSSIPRLAQDIDKQRGSDRANGGTYKAKAVGHPASGRNRRSVWTITTKGFSEAHFATFPPALIEPMILAGTSERGCCSVCGAPWERVVERTPMQVTPAPSREERSQNGQLRTQVNGTMVEPPTSETIGWRTCECCHVCDHNKLHGEGEKCRPYDTAPCTVLDPFGGAGTTGLVADRLGRNAILIELNPDYAEMARRRIINDAGMFAQVTVEGVAA